MMFDLSVVYKEYKNIRRTILDGYLLPYYLNVLEVPVEYDYTSLGWKRIINQINDDEMNSLLEASKNRRRESLMIMKGLSDDYDNLEEYYTREVSDFIEEYPQFNGILTQEIGGRERLNG